MSGQRQRCDQGGQANNHVKLPWPPPPALYAVEQLHGHGDEVGTVGRVRRACQYLYGGDVFAEN